jgi:hypothetical protein
MFVGIRSGESANSAKRRFPRTRSRSTSSVHRSPSSSSVHATGQRDRRTTAAATLVGLEAPSGTRMIELKPYALSGLATDTTVTPRLSNDVTKRIGGDLRYGVTQNVTVDVTVKHRFRARKVDEQQSTLRASICPFPSVAESSIFGDALEWGVTGLDRRPRNLQAETLDGLRGRGACLRRERAREVPRAHRRLLSDLLDRQAPRRDDFSSSRPAGRSALCDRRDPRAPRTVTGHLADADAGRVAARSVERLPDQGRLR